MRRLSDFLSLFAVVKLQPAHMRRILQLADQSLENLRPGTIQAMAVADKFVVVQCMQVLDGAARCLNTTLADRFVVVKCMQVLEDRRRLAVVF